jgi:hypothetical protein
MRRASSWSLLALLLAPGLAAAQGQNHLYDKLQLAGSGTLLIYSTTIRIDPEGGGEGTTIDAEEVLGLEKTNFQPRGAGRFRMGRRHELELGFQWADRSAEKVLTETITIGDSTFDAGLTVNSTLNTSQAFLNYRFAFTAKENTMIGFTVGLGPIFLEERISARAEVVGGPSVERSQGESLVGPTASLGLFGRFRLGEKWYLEADARGLYVKVSNIKAEVYELGAAVRYFFSDSFGGELGYNLGSYAVTLSRDGDLIDLSGRVKYTAQGIRAGIVFVP